MASHPMHNLSKGAQILVVTPCGGKRSCVHFNHPASLNDLLEGWMPEDDGHFGEQGEGAMLQISCVEPLSMSDTNYSQEREHTNCFPHGGAADPKLSTELLFGWKTAPRLCL